MGAWGKGIFENDGAADWTDTLEEGDGLGHIARTLGEINDAARDDIRRGDHESGFAAAAVVAAIFGGPADDLSDTVVEWIEEEAPSPQPEIIGRAIGAAGRLLPIAGDPRTSITKPGPSGPARGRRHPRQPELDPPDPEGRR